MRITARRLGAICAAGACAVSLTIALHGQQPKPRVPRLWTDEALRGWALPIAGVNTAPSFYTEAEYYAAPIDELRTYPV